ncbi:MAG: histidine phosphatase family protein [Clostridia bacterium]|nr:histidine phosphatase family protein [Clostridia bacterium]
MKTTAIIVRHGFSETNRDDKFAGQLDVKLTDIGHKQAQLVSEYIAKAYKVDKIYSSDLSRAFDTVKPLADKLGIEINTDKGLREIFAGVWEGRYLMDIANEYPEDYKVWKENVGLARCTGGESFAESQKRIINAIETILKNERGKTVVIATHGGVLRTYECYLKNVSLEEMKNIKHMNNAAVSIIEHDGKTTTVKAWNITEHLGEFCTSMPKGV